MESSSQSETEKKLSPDEQLKSIRLHLIQNIIKKYADFINEFVKLPFDISNFKRSFDHFDDGILWAKEIISCVQFIDKSLKESNPSSIEP